MGFRDIIRSEDPSRALYLALRANPTLSRAADTFQGGFEGAMEGLGNVGRVLTIPTRALAGTAANMAGTGANIDVPRYALTGEGANVEYGDLLADTLETEGSLAPGGTASKLLRLLGNAATDPLAAAGVMTGADALGAMAGGSKMTPAFAAPRTVQPMPRSRLAGPRGVPTGGPGADLAGSAGPGGAPPRPPRNPLKPVGPKGRVGGGLPRGPRGPQPPLGGGPVPSEPLPPLAPTGPRPPAGAELPMPRFSTSGYAGWREPRLGPTATQPVPLFDPNATQRVPMVRKGKGAKRQLEPKAQRKRAAKKSKSKGDDE